MRKYEPRTSDEEEESTSDLDQANSPALACPAPIFAPAPQRGSPWSASLGSPQPFVTFNSPTGLSSSGPSAFTAVSPTNPASSLTTSTATIYDQLMCIPKLLQEISNNNHKVLRTRMNNTAYKPIPNSEKVDLARFRVKDPNEWLCDDVMAWVLDVAKRHNIPFDQLNLHGFSTVSGQEMRLMSEQAFIEKDSSNGNLIFNEFRKFVINAEDTTLDTVISKFVDDEIATTSASAQCIDMSSLGLTPMISNITSSIQPPIPHPASQLGQLPVMQHQLNNLSSLTQVLTQQPFNPTILTPQQTANAVQSLNQSLTLNNPLNQSLASSLAAGLTSGLSPLGVNYLPNGLNPTSPLLATQIPQPKMSPMLKYSCSINSEYELPEERSAESCDLKIKKNKDGKPRKRSQHTKGNKLWEFIRDALKDPSTCPSVVRWEDPIEGVFRIVESEKLARLWGARKNNEKMTYEKLSRAMRTYYEKQILVPVPKTGLYPKKLVYKFGPGAHGWENVKIERM
ncbi:unnamed protein product [Caenorhabditis nigoni]